MPLIRKENIEELDRHNKPKRKKKKKKKRRSKGEGEQNPGEDVEGRTRTSVAFSRGPLQCARALALMTDGDDDDGGGGGNSSGGGRGGTSKDEFSQSAQSAPRHAIVRMFIYLISSRTDDEITTRRSNESSNFGTSRFQSSWTTLLRKRTVHSLLPGRITVNFSDNFQSLRGRRRAFASYVHTRILERESEIMQAPTAMRNKANITRLFTAHA
ncbi:hypothetical protein V1478_007214, partial [Vespula squamosa]